MFRLNCKQLYLRPHTIKKQLNQPNFSLGQVSSHLFFSSSSDEPKKESKRLSEFRKKLRETTPIDDLGDQPLMHPAQKDDPLPAWPDNTNPHTGEVGGPRGPEPTRYGDWERKGRVTDF